MASHETRDGRAHYLFPNEQLHVGRLGCSGDGEGSGLLDTGNYTTGRPLEPAQMTPLYWVTRRLAGSQTRPCCPQAGGGRRTADGGRRTADGIARNAQATGCVFDLGVVVLGKALGTSRAVAVAIPETRSGYALRRRARQALGAPPRGDSQRRVNNSEEACGMSRSGSTPLRASASTTRPSRRDA